jgi:hypothetical protein
MNTIGYRNPRFYQARQTMPRLDSPQACLPPQAATPRASESNEQTRRPDSPKAPQREALAAEGKQAGQAGKQAELLMPLVPSEGSIAKNALLSRVSELGIGVNKARVFLASLVDRGMLFEWHIPRPGTNPEVRIARHEQLQGPGDL